MATHFSVLSWRIPWIEEPGWLQSMGSQIVGHDSMHATLQLIQNVVVQMNNKVIQLYIHIYLFFHIFRLFSLMCCAQLCLTLCDPMDYGQPGSSVHGILQARALEQAAIFYSGDLPYPRIEPRSPPHCRQILYHLSHQGSPFYTYPTAGSRE